MNKKYRIVGALFLILAGTAWWYFDKPTAGNENSHAQAGPPGSPPGSPMPVKVTVLALQPARTQHEFSGKLVAVERVSIRTRVPGAIDKIYFQPGAVVEKGDPLFLIDPRPYRAAVSQAAAMLATARAQAALAGTEASRAERLIKDNAISQREYASRTNATQIANAGIQSAQAALQQAQLNLDYATIIAPVRGKISRAEVTAGNLVDPGQGQVLAEIVSIDPIYADFDVDEQTYLQHVRQKDSETDQALPIELILKSDARTIYLGKIVSFDPQLDTTSGTIRARAVFKNKNQDLVPGMFVTVHMSGVDSNEAILVSDRFVSTDQDKKFVYVVGDDNKVEYRPVVLGSVTNDGKRIIDSGLQPGERIVVEGMTHLRPGMPVTATETDDHASDDAKQPEANAAPQEP